MNFDEKLVATSLNQLTLKEGDSVIVANSVQMLRCKVMDNAEILTLSHILPDNYERRFCVGAPTAFALAYPISNELKEKTYRPYKHRAELVNSYRNYFSEHYEDDFIIPTIWVKEKKTKNIYAILGFDSRCGASAGVFVYYVGFVSYERLLSDFTFQLNMVCGIMEE